ncbi:MAG: folylpolyglutamate synthase/dihydrofolate synthase family protein [Lachnospiraceae bacterium]|nr:folylpolyglutamate synthase/dihydrofolate synthase family protein [Lachnospiraceae bacterium]
MNYEETVKYIEEVPKFTKKTTLEHTRKILEELGNPDQGLKIIHVAGTNGKGSVCAYLNSMLTEGGYKVGLFTSPHLIRTNERFMIGGVPVDDDTFCAAFERVMEASKRTMERGESHPTYFEILLLMGLVIFSQEKVDYVVLETGLGGRLDATNVITDPLACIIVSISRDHTEYLGETIPEIAAEKAGIIKAGVPVVYDGRNQAAAQVIGAKAEELHSPAYVLEESMVELLSNTREGIRFLFNYPGQEPVEMKIPYVAEYQMMNASLAYFTMKKLYSHHGISDEALMRGIMQTKWACRMETVMEGVIIDGAHNEDGVAQFIKTAVHFRKDNAITILFSAVSDKHYKDMIREIVEGIRPDHVVTTQIQGYREVPAEELAELFRQQGAEQVEAVTQIGPAFDRACQLKGEGMLFCVGSLYLAGELKSWIQQHKGDATC